MSRSSQANIEKRRSAESGQQGSFFPALPNSSSLSINHGGDELEKEAKMVAEKFGNNKEGLHQDSNENRFSSEVTQNINSPINSGNAKSQKIQLAGGNGNSLPTNLKKEYEQEFNSDFSHVKIHTDNHSSDLNKHLGAKAFTFRNDIFFNSGRSNFNSTAGKKLLAHELTHVLQGTNQIQRDPDEDAEKAEQDKIAKLKSGIKAAFSLKSVEDGSSNWTSEELRITKEGIEIIPKADIPALKDVVLRRVNSLGDNTAGQFGSKQSVEDTTVTNEYELEIADLNFSKGTTEAAQKRLVQHEVGHAIASLPSRKANLESNEALAKFNEKMNLQNDSADPFNTANDEFNDAVTDYNSKVDEYDNESDPTLKKQLKSDVNALRKIVEQKRTERTKKETDFNSAEGVAKKAKATWEKKDKEAKKHNISQSDLDAIKKNADSAKTDHDTALATSKGKITAKMTDLEEAKQYATSVESLSTKIDSFYTETKDQKKSESEVETLIEAINKQINTRGQAFESLSKKDGKHPLLTILPSFEKYQDTFFHIAKANALAHERSARVQKFVEFVEKNNIQPISDYARKNWPHKPEEFYAEAYSFWVSNKLNSISPELKKWFDGKKYK